MNKKIILLVALLVLVVSLTACKSTPVDVVSHNNSVDANQPVNTDQVASDVTADLIPENDSVELGEMI